MQFSVFISVRFDFVAIYINWGNHNCPVPLTLLYSEWHGQQSFGHSECNKVKWNLFGSGYKRIFKKKKKKIKKNYGS